MKPIFAVGIAAALALGGCGSSHGSAAAVPAQAIAGQTPPDPRPSSQERTQSPGYPGRRAAVRLFNLVINLFDAPLIGATAANAQFNAGILGVDAIDCERRFLAAHRQHGSASREPAGAAKLVAADGQRIAAGGTYPSVQLLLDPATTTVTYNGQTYPARFTDPNHPWWDPAQTVEAVNVPLTVSGNDGDSLSATLDFNVFQSANLADGVVYLTPTVAGGMGSPTINGNVANAAGQPVSNATVIATDSHGNVANTTLTGADGSFHIRGINPGSYTVSVANTFTTNAGVTVTASGADDGAAPSAQAVVGPNTQLTIATLRD